MREILFRGKRVDNGEWAEGYYICDKVFCGKLDPHAYIVNHKHPSSCFGSDICIEVDPDTVGQYTGRTDKNGKKIFEGDILSFGEETYYVAWDNDDCGYCKISIDGGTPIQESFDWFYSGLSEILGNIHDTELLEVQGEKGDAT